ncbi:alpha/beta hydrolase [Spirochaetia bacterium]|nr:alpha/beta hydrolase [Spirochaetia bacterium]
MLKQLVLLLYTCLHFVVALQAQVHSVFHELPIALHTPAGTIEGTLSLPESTAPMPVALIIAGSGPTDRNGNNPSMQNQSLKMLADSLATHGIASVRFDKRGIGASAAALKSESDIRFTDYVQDAIAWLQLLHRDKRFNSIIVIGHSEGSLIGMLASKHSADAFVSIAGAGKSAGTLLKEQLAKQPEVIRNWIYADIDTLEMGKTLQYVNPLLYNLFRPSIQPYLISWFRYNPTTVIQQLSNLPVCIIQGMNDIQVSEADAQLLAKASTKAKLVMIPHMNHIFKMVTGDRNVNLDTYNNPQLPIREQLVEAIVTFIDGLH